MMKQKKNLHEIIAKNIHEERVRQQLSQFELAEKAGISLDTIKSIESGRRNMSLDTYINIVRALETSTSQLLNEDKVDDYLDRFNALVMERSQREIEFALYVLEMIFNGMDDYCN